MTNAVSSDLPPLPAPGVHHLDLAPAVTARLARAHGLVLAEADGGAGAPPDKAAILAALARALALPGWFGGNLDALYDSVAEREMDTLLVLRRLTQGAAGAAILDVLGDAAVELAGRGRRLIVLVA